MTDTHIIVRTARKPWACEAREHHVDCGRQIRPGMLYAEYLGEAHAYQSGSRYSLTCARAEFGEDAFEVPTCSHGFERGGLCVDCREARTGVPLRDDE